MKIFCTKNELNKAINNVLHAVPTRTTSRILEGILVEIRQGMMFLTTTDTSITIETKIEANSNEEASFVVMAKLFSIIVSKLPEEDVMIEYDPSRLKIKIKSGNSSSELLCFSADEFPKMMTSEGKKIFLSKDTVRKLIRKTAFSASSDELNGVLTGVLVEIKDRNLRMVAVDTFRMAIYNAEVDVEEEISVVVPAKLLNEVAKIISDDQEDEQLVLEIVDNKIVFFFDNNKVIVNTLNGKFIDYSRIIKSGSEIKIRVMREELVKSIDRASILASAQNNNLIKFEIGEDLIDISSLSDEGNIEEKVEIIKDGEDLKIGFNARYMMDILKVIEDEEVILNMKDSVSPCMMKPLKGETYLYLVLPVRIS